MPPEQIHLQMLWLRKHPFIPSLKDLLSAPMEKVLRQVLWVIKGENNPCLKEFIVQYSKEKKQKHIHTLLPNTQGGMW